MFVAGESMSSRIRTPQLEDLPAGRVREYQVKLTEAADDLGPVPDSKRTNGGHRVDSAVRCTSSSSTTVTT
jgi:hypothetical protein